jgi:DNA-directed RNA polymerase specialized sigma subunit
MPVAMKKPHIDEEMVTIRLRVRRSNASKIKSYAYSVESEGEPSYSLEEVFPELAGKEKQVYLKGIRYREDLTQKQLADLTGIPQRHISEMENSIRPIGKENAKKLAKVLNADYRMLL